MIHDKDLYPLIEDALSIAKAAEKLSHASRYMGGYHEGYDEDGNKTALEDLAANQPIALEQIKIIENYAVLLRCKCAELQALAEAQGCELSESELNIMKDLK